MSLSYKRAINQCSTTIGFLSGFDALTDYTNQLSVQAAVHTEGDAAAYSCEDEESEAPDPGHTPGDFLREVIGLSAADGAHESSAGDVDGDDDVVVGDEAQVKLNLP